MYWHFFHMPGTVSDASRNNVNMDTTRIEIISKSMTASCIAMLCLLTMFVNIWVCYKIYSKRSLRSSCTALIVANVALVDILVSIKDLPFLLSVALSSKWYFETEWCRSYGLTNVVYIIVSVSTLVSIATDHYIVTRENESDKSGQYPISGQSNFSPAPHKVALLGYVVAQTTLSYSLTLLWSKYAFLSRKAFCQVEFSSSGFHVSMLVSFLFLIPIATLTFTMLNNISGGKKQTVVPMLKSSSGNKNESTTETEDQRMSEEEAQIHYHLQAAIGIFLLSWCSYVVDSFFPSPQSPSIPGIVSAFIPIMTTSLVPFFFVLTHKTRASVTYDSNKLESAYRLA